MSKNTFSTSHKASDDFIKEPVPPKKNYIPLGYKASKDPRKDRSKVQMNLLNELTSSKSKPKPNLFILSILIFLSIISQVKTSKEAELRGLQTNNYITLIFQGTGSTPIINNTFISSLASIKIITNEEITGPINQVQTLTSDTNTIKMTLNSQLTSCSNMFKGLQKLISVDLTNLDFSLVSEMDSFFEGCSSLKSVNFANKEAPELISMNSIFKGCKSLTSVNFNNFRAEKLKDLSQIFSGCEKIVSIDLSSFNSPDLLSLAYSFYGCESLENINMNNLKTSKVIGMQSMFQYCKSLSSLNLNNFDTTSVTRLDQMFSQCSDLTSLDLSSFRTPNLVSMYAMFYNNSKLTSLDISNFNTTRVENMAQVFDQCHSIKSLDLSHFYTPSCVNMWHLFYNCFSLEFIDVRNFNTDKISGFDGLFINCNSLTSLDIRHFNTSLAESLESMFSGCKSLTSLDVTNFDTSLVKSMQSMFYGCNALTSLDLRSFKTEKVINMTAMFRDCKSIKSLDLKHFKTPELKRMAELFSYCNSLEFLDISNFNTEKVSDMSFVFCDCKALTSIDVQNFDTSLVTNMALMFRGCNKLTSLNVSHFKTDLVTTMQQMFDQCNLLTSLDVSNFYTPRLTNVYNMFYNCYTMTYLNVSHMDTSKVDSFNGMFTNCQALTSLDVSNFDTKKAKYMSNMFNGCKTVKVLDLQNFYTPNLLEANGIFSNCESLTSIDISNFNTSKATNIAGMFAKCYKLTSIDITHFDTRNVKYFHYLFDNCQSLPDVDISNFDTRNAINIGHMFDQCHSITSVNLSHFNTSQVTAMENMFYNANQLKYLDVSTFNTEKVKNKSMDTVFISTRNLLFLNLSSFTIYNDTAINNFLTSTYSGIILCYNESKMPDHFLDHVKNLENSCFKLCIMLNKKYILDKEMCVFNCFSEVEYKYEYKNVCYTECPIRTQLKADSTYLCEDCPHYYSYNGTRCIDTIPIGYYSNSTTEKYIDKCPSKCKSCSYESINNNELCTECDISNGYYPKSVDALNTGSFYQCYHTSEMQIGFYLDDSTNTFKPCYFSCNKCNIGGNDANNNCQECKSEYNLVSGNCICKNYFNYEKTACIDEIPEGYYLNSATEKTIDKCPVKCKTCSSESMTHNLCISSNTDQNYYPKLNDISNIDPFIQCYHTSEVVTDYYLDNSEKIFKPCYYACNTCNIGGNNVNNNCVECKSEYNLVSGNCICKNYFNYEKTTCIDSIPEGYYLYSATEKTIEKCPEKCGSCSLESLNNNQCISCNTNSNNYYPKLNDESNISPFIQCYHKSEVTTDYYLDNSEKIFKPCYERCNTCSGEGDEDNNNCLQCKDDYDYDNGMCKDRELICPIYYNYEKTACLDTIPQGFYLKTPSGKYIDKCPLKCKSCSYDSMGNELCTECDNNNNYYSKLNDELNIDPFYQCYHTSEVLTDYYLDDSEKLFKPCYKTCNKCGGEGNDENNNCLDCKDTYNFDNGNCKCINYNNYERTGCIDSIPIGFYLNSTSEKTIDKCPLKCKSCSQESMNNNLCVECDTNNNYYPKLNDVSNISPFYQCYHTSEVLTDYYLDTSGKIFKPCYERCNKCNVEGNDENNNCLECKDGYILDNGNCKCAYYNNYERTGCISEIPSGYYLNSTSEKTIDKCPLKCKTCTQESIKKNLCTSCNTDANFYLKSFDESNKGSFVQCYDNNEEQIGYYLDTTAKFFKPCYDTCYKCSGKGNDENNNCLECKDGYFFNNGNCQTEQLESTIASNGNGGKKYSYNINENNEEMKLKSSQVYIDINEETMSMIKNKFSLTGDSKIFIAITEKPNNDSNFATVDYVYEYVLENGTKLNLSDLEEATVDVYVPFTDLDLAQFNLVKQFAEQGYDIYDINSPFYNDYCTPASIDGNDITLDDRKKDIYPHNVTLCKSNCKYKGINIDEQRVICECNINSDINITENEILIDEDNFKDYFLDNINFRVFQCYKLFFDGKNLKKSKAFYIIIIIYLIMAILNLIYTCYSFERLKLHMAREMFSIKASNKELFTEAQKVNESQEIDSNKYANPLKKELEKKKNKKSKEGKGVKNKAKSEKNVLVSISKFMNKKGSTRNYYNVANTERTKELPEEDEDSKEENINELPYSKAIDVDKRSISHIFCSFIVEKLELVSICFYEYQIKSILLSEYILALLLNFFFNTLLYSDDVVSNKYHNNGKLDFAVSLLLSILSNIVTSMIFYCIKYSRGIEERMKLILEIKYKMHCYRNIKRFFKYLKIKLVCFVISQLIISGVCTYYIVTFCILYSHSQKSLVVNYLYSLIESIITSIVITTIILITRKIGLSCLNKEIYNTSKYINSKF